MSEGKDRGAGGGGVWWVNSQQLSKLLDTSLPHSFHLPKESIWPGMRDFGYFEK